MINPTCQFNARIVPTPDATDFPPVKFKNIDLLCPRITATAAITGNKPIAVKLFANIAASITGKAPLKASSKSVMKNHFLPITLFTFVAPVEPEPIFLMSSFLNAFTIIYPVGIEPIKYAPIATARISIIFSIVYPLKMNIYSVNFV